MKYIDIPVNTKKELFKKKQTMHLYGAIYRDVMEILRILLPSDKAMVVGEHLKSIMRSLIELKTGNRSEKF